MQHKAKTNPCPIKTLVSLLLIVKFRIRSNIPLANNTHYITQLLISAVTSVICSEKKVLYSLNTATD